MIRLWRQKPRSKGMAAFGVLLLLLALSLWFGDSSPKIFQILLSLMGGAAIGFSLGDVEIRLERFLRYLTSLIRPKKFFGDRLDIYQDIATVLIRRDGLILEASPEARKILKISKRAPNEYLENVLGDLGQSVSTWTKTAVDGKIVQHTALLRALNHATDQFVQMSWINRKDLTRDARYAILTEANEHKQLETQFVQSQKMQAIGQLAGGVAHDFNNLLTAISGYCDLLLLGRKQDHPDYSDLVQISQNAERAADLVSHLLAFSRKQKNSPVTVEINQLLSALSTLLNRLVGEKIQLTFDRSEEPLFVFADARQLEQVFMNLIVNSRDAMPIGGEIEMKTSVSASQKNWPSELAIESGEYVSIVVKDTGKGISPQNLSKIFDPFFTTKEVGKGTGLGLSTVYGIVKQAGGYVFVDSEIGIGTEITVLLPRQDESAEQTNEVQNEDAMQTLGLSKAKVLLVEDEDAVRKFTARALSLQDMIVLDFGTSEEAIQKIEEDGYVPDLIISDVVMPGMDGPTWVERARETLPDVKVIFVSGYAREQLANAREKISGSIFLQKPFSLPDLISTSKDQLSSDIVTDEADKA